MSISTPYVAINEHSVMAVISFQRRSAALAIVNRSTDGACAPSMSSMYSIGASVTWFCNYYYPLLALLDVLSRHNPADHCAKPEQPEAQQQVCYGFAAVPTDNHGAVITPIMPKNFCTWVRDALAT